MYDILYDRLFDAGAESEGLHQLIQQRLPGAHNLLDVACCTGRHLAHLRAHYRVEGVDREPAMLREARPKLPGVRLTGGDLLDLSLPRRFDIVTCLFSSIAYVQTPAALRRAIRNLAAHVRAGRVGCRKSVRGSRRLPRVFVQQAASTRSTDNLARLARVFLA